MSLDVDLFFLIQGEFVIFVVHKRYGILSRLTRHDAQRLWKPM
jgi:hypothetical protein